MDAILTYSLQVNVLLALLFIGYRFLLRGLTFYKLNRLYLLGGAVYAFVYPFVDMKRFFAETVPLPEGKLLMYFPMLSQTEPEFGLPHILIGLLGLGGATCLLVLLIRLASLMRLHRRSKQAFWWGYGYRNVFFPIRPFSFFNRIYLHKEQHPDSELQAIFKHESVHVEGLHSVDMIVFEVIMVVCWYNPLVWLMRRAVRQNLEFLTDQQVLKQGVDRQYYQYALVQVVQPPDGSAMGNPFNFNYLKKRIMMMNKKRSSRAQMGRYAFLLPTLLFAGIVCTVNQANAKIEHVVAKLGDRDLDNRLREIVGTDITTESEQGSVLKTRGIDALQRAESRPLGSVKGQLGSQAGETASTIRNEIGDSSLDTLVIVDGKEISGGLDAASLDPDAIKSVEVLKDETATNRYGEKGRNGVLLITLKDAEEVKQKQKASPLVIVDGDEIPGGLEAASLDPNAIKSTVVLKDEKATDLYGEKGKDGVVLIELKQSNESTQEHAGG